MCSMPTDRRTVSCVTPAASSSSALSCECVVVALWIASDLRVADVREVAEQLEALDERLAGLAARPSMPNVTRPPKPPVSVRLATSWYGLDSRGPGS